MRERPFSQIDVFASAPYQGNALAVVADGEGLDEAQMHAFARWTNLSETTFLLPPRDTRADYRVRIFTVTRELPFAGHPTLGSAHAWLEAGGAPKMQGVIVQECGAGLIDIRRGSESLAFTAPPLRREGPVARDLAERIVHGLRVDASRVRAMQWADNGPDWIGVLLDSARSVLELEIDRVALNGLNVGVIGPHAMNGPADFEVRAFFTDGGVIEDPVTGSLNASLAQWLIGSDVVPPRYRARQGTAIGRMGIVEIEQDGGRIWVGGTCTTCIKGTVQL
jgi:PhzF family phenazine biosynthesis protein